MRVPTTITTLSLWEKMKTERRNMLPIVAQWAASSVTHASLESTYYYIHLIPDYFPQYSALAASTEDLIPEVEDNEI